MDELEKAFDFNNVIDLLNGRISRFIPEVKDNLATRNVILMAHNTIEAILNLLLSRYYLGEAREKIDKDKVNHFWINILIEMDCNKKIKILKDINVLEENITAAFYRINDIRNDIAHFPHRAYKRKDKHLLYDGKHIFKDVQALKSFYRDFDLILTEARKFIEK